MTTIMTPNMAGERATATNGPAQLRLESRRADTEKGHHYECVRFPAAFIGVQGQVLQDRARRAHPPGLLGDILGQLAHDDAHIPKELQRVAWQMAS